MTSPPNGFSCPRLTRDPDHIHVRQQQDGRRRGMGRPKTPNERRAIGHGLEQVRFDARRVKHLIDVSGEDHLVPRRIRRIDLNQAREVRDHLIAQTVPVGLG
jgi:hypothetical protein